jgi:FKBP-type peptidyl-prolyl cis-trans isomerase
VFKKDCRSIPRTAILKRKKETIVKTKNYSVILALGCLLVMSVFAAEQASKEDINVPVSEGQATNPQASVFKTEQDKVSYIIGTQIAQSIKKQGVEVNIEPLMWGLQDVLEGNTLKMTKEETQKVYMAFQQRMRAKQTAERAKQATENLAKGKAFLEANKTKEGVTALPSGLQYKVIKEGTGDTPTAEDKVKTHYRGRLLDGTEFDSSYKRNQPAEFPVKGVIKGWTEALQLMKTGAKWELYIPADLAYGERGRPSIPPNSVLIFEIELLEVVK